MPTLNAAKIVFKHMIELKSCGCVFCYTQEENSGRTRLFLIFKEQGRVYWRNGLRGTWEEFPSSQDASQIIEAYDLVVAEQKVPCFATSVQDLACV